MRCAWLALLALQASSVTSTADCLRNIYSSSPTSALLESPHYPLSYPAGINCIYNITTVSSNVIHISFLAFDLAEPHAETKQCLDAYVIIIVVDRQGKEHIGPRLCGKSVPKKFETMQPALRVRFVTSAAGGSNRGFRLQYDILSEAAIREPKSAMSPDEIQILGACGGRSRPGELTGEIVSPGYPTTYPKNCSCNWLIRVEPRQRIYVRLVHLHLAKTIAECERAQLSIVDGYKHEDGNERKEIFGDGSQAHFCGTQTYYAEEGMRTYLSSGNRLLLKFTTTGPPSSDIIEESRIGFKVVWTAVESLVGDPSISQEVIPVEKCDQFVCKGGHLCIDQGQGACQSRTQLCISSSLVCNGINNCVEGDYSDEQHCYSREIVAASAIGLASLLLLIVICICCDQWRKRRRLRYLIQESRHQNGKSTLLHPNPMVQRPMR